jgi:hypothetical protein
MKNIRVVKLVALLSVSLLAASCYNQNCDWSKSDNDLFEQSKSMSMREIYDLHLKLCKECTPRRFTLASRLGEFGEPARSLAVDEAGLHEASGFFAALDVVRAVTDATHRPCTDDQRSRLLQAANRMAREGEITSRTDTVVSEACASKAS